MKNKSLLKKILLITSILISAVSNVRAVTVDYVDDTNSCSEKGVCPITGPGDLRIGGGEVFHMSDGRKAYCIDPDMRAPKKNESFVEDNSAISPNEAKGFAAICQKTVGMSYLKRASALKAYSAMYGETGNDNDITARYKWLFDGSGDAVWNKGKYGEFDIVGVVNAANTASKATATSSYQITNNGNYIQLNTTIPMKVSVGSGYELNIGGSPVGGSSSNLNSGSYKIEVKSPSSSCSGSIEVTFTYDEMYAGSSGVTVYKGAGDLQRLLACNDSPGGTCTKDASGDCIEKETITLTCAPKCPTTNPQVDYTGNASDGDSKCKADGQTVVKVTETPNDIFTATESEISCIEDDEHDATDVILGTSNDYCKIYCTENYELVLPGPDRRNSDKEVFINAGSYFTIDEKDDLGKSTMYDINTISCYGKRDYKTFKDDITGLRNNVVNAYNAWSKQNAKVNPSSSDMTQTYTLDSSGNSVPDKCIVNAKYKKLSMDSNGNITDSTDSNSFNFSGKCSDYSASSSDTSDLTNLQKELNTAIDDANKKIPKIEESWKLCLNWNMDNLVNLYKSNDSCNATIGFSYEEKVGVVVDTKTPSGNGRSTINNSAATSTINVGVCTDKGLDCNRTSTYNTSYKYVNNQVVFTTTYKFDNGFVVNYETGDFDWDESKAGGEYSEVIYGFPISLKTTQGIGTYEYTYSHIGHNFDKMSFTSCDMGRFDSDLSKAPNYGCYYDVNNCKDCDVDCSGPGCTIKIPDPNKCDKDCKVACVGGGCIVDFNAGFLATYRTISLNDLKFAYNTKVLSSEPAKLLAVASTKDYDYKTRGNKSNWGTDKGIKARSDITTAGETIYEKEPEYKITLTPGVINEIRKYNEKAEKDGKGYLNDTLTCKDSLGKGYGQCESSFISDPDFQIKRKNNKLNFETYPGATGAFEGPAWK